MDPLPLSQVSTLNIIQILQKCNDVSFGRIIRTNRRMYELAHQMGKKNRMKTTAYLPVFVYFDKKEKKAMIDLPCKKGCMRPYLTSKPPIPASERVEDYLRRKLKTKRRPLKDRYEEDRRHCFNFSSDCCFKWEGFLHDHPASQVKLIRSDRSRAVHQKLAVEELGQILKLFKFETVAIHSNNNEERAHPKKLRPHPRRFDVAEEIIKILSYLEAQTLTLHRPDSLDLFQRTVSTANENFKFKRLYMHFPPRMSSHYGFLDQLEMDWHTLEGLEVQCTSTDLLEIYNDFVQRWQAGQTNLKYLKLHIDGSPTDNFQSPGILLQMPAYWAEDTFHFIYSVANNRWAITYYCLQFGNFYFYDISDCDDCNCQTDFCFKKLTEVLATRINWRDAINWGTVVDEWNGMQEKTMEALGALLKKFMDIHHKKLEYWYCDCCADMAPQLGRAVRLCRAVRRLFKSAN